LPFGEGGEIDRASVNAQICTEQRTTAYSTEQTSFCARQLSKTADRK